MCEAESPGLGVETEVLKVEELGRLALAITLAGSYVAATLRLRSAIRLCLPEYHERQKQLPGMNTSVLSMRETSLAALERQSPTAARLLS
jgi:hypothetical protein